MAGEVPLGALDAQQPEDWRDREAREGLKYGLEKEAADKASKQSWYDKANEVAHGPGRILGALTASPASPEADQAAMMPETFVSPLVKNTMDALGGAVKSGVTAAHDIGTGQVPMYDEEGKPSKEAIGRVFDMATLGGGASIAGTASKLNNPGLDLRLAGKQLASDSGKAAVPIAAAEHAQPFYSGLERVVAEHPQEMMPASQWAGTLANKLGVKAEERQATGTDKFLADRGQSPLTKTELLDHLEKNKVQIGEVTKSEFPASWDQLDGSQRYDVYDKFNGIHGRPPHTDELPDWYNEIAQYSREGNETALDGAFKPPRYAGYQLPGGENYREKLLTLPKASERETPGGMKVSYDDRGNDLNYRSSHWDEPNVVVHQRMNDRDVLGAGEDAAKKALHLEELQSDWHQEGRKRGYDLGPQFEKKKADLDARIFEALAPAPTDLGPMGRMNWAEKNIPGFADLLKEKATLADASRSGGVPDAPFKKNWHELALKRALHDAAEGGYDRLSWTPGEAQAARYDLSKQVDRIGYTKRADGKYNLTAEKGGNPLISEDGITIDRISDLVGKDMAKKIEGGEGNVYDTYGGSKTAELTGLDLKVGGEGMKGFYDKIVPDYLNKVGKAHGAQVKEGTIEAPYYGTGRGNLKIMRPQSHPVHYMDITPSLRQHLLTKGMPLFEDSSPGAAVSVARHAGEGNAERAAGAKAGLDERGGLAGSAGRDPRVAEAEAAAARGAGAIKPLEGLPVKPVSINGEPYVPGPIESVHNVARQYMEGTGRPYDRLDRYHPLDVEHSKAIAKAFDEMKHEPDNPKVRASYNAMIKETRGQYDAAMKSGLKAEPIRDGIDPYATNPRLAAKDVRDNNHLWYFPTEQGFGTSEQGGIDMATHPMMQPSGRLDVNGKPMLNNDLFRVVHDYFGHLKEGNGFRAGGEDNAWRTHAKMYSDLARPAMTSETRGQNSWVNYGPHGDFNRTASAADTHYTDQKVGLMPEWTMRDRDVGHPALEAADAGRAVTNPHEQPYPGAKYPQYAEAYPEAGAPKLFDKANGKPVTDKISKKELARRLELPKSDPKAVYWGKELTPEAKAFQKDRDTIRKDMEGKGFEPYFDPEGREHVNPADYPTPHDMTRDALPAKQATIDSYKAKFDTPEARARLQKAFDEGKNIKGANHWYAMRQLEQQYIRHLGPDEGKRLFAEQFARTMAATTGGNDPTSNLLLAHYVQWAQKNGQLIPEESHQLPFPIGGRYVANNVKQFKQMPPEGFDADNPKRHDFEHAFLGHPNKATMDEQMSGGIIPGMQIPPGDSYGVAAQLIHDLAKKNGVHPRDFQDITWAGLKKLKTEAEGKKFNYEGPMIGHLNSAIERTHRLTGMPREEIVRRGVVKKEIPLYANSPPLGALDSRQDDK